MPINTAEIKAEIARIILVSEDNTASFPYCDPDNLVSGPAFLADCEEMGWPVMLIGRDVYVFAAMEADQ